MLGTQLWRRSFEWKLIGIQSTQVSTLNMISEAANVATCLYRYGRESVVILIVEEVNTSDSLCFPVTLVLWQGTGKGKLMQG